VFHILKNIFGYKKVCYRGLQKNGAHLYTLFALANLYKHRHKLAASARPI